MGLMDWLLRRRGVTFDWAARPGAELAADLDRATFCGVPIGGPLQKLSFLGPCDAPREISRLLDYAKHGLYLAHDDEGRLDVVSLFPAGWKDHAPFAGKWLVRGAAVPITGRTSREDLLQLLGEPEWEEDDGGEVTWYFPRGEAEWQFTWSQAGPLASVELAPAEEKDPEYVHRYGEETPGEADSAEGRGR